MLVKDNSGNQDSNSFDLDNSDELNKFISKYEEQNLHDNPVSKKGSALSSHKKTSVGDNRVVKN